MVFLFFGIIIFSIIVIVVNFVNKNQNITIIKEKNPTDNKIKNELNKLKKLYENGLIKKSFRRKTKGNFKIILIKNSIKNKITIINLI